MKTRKKKEKGGERAMVREREREGGMGPVSLPLNIYKDLHFFRIFRQKMGQTENLTDR